MIRRWNAVVSDNDLVYHLGDFCSGRWLAAANCSLSLRDANSFVIGNHDTYLSPQEWRDLWL